MESSADLESQLVESLNSIATIKRFGVEDFANLKTENRFVVLLKNTFRSIYGSILANNGVQFISTGITIVVLWVGSTLVIDKSITPGTLMLFYSLVGYVISPIGSIITSNQTIQDALIAADRLFQIMDLEVEEESMLCFDLEPDMINGIVFEDVYFRYGSRKQVFEKLNLKIETGKTTAIVGESGSGKTTLVSLLQHIYPIQDGEIRIGSYQIKNLSNRSLRRYVGSVPQQIELFAGTIIENIALGDFNPDMQKITNIIEQLGLKEFIDRLPNGYNTIIGEHGTSLSGGERQRIAIARMMYKDPMILIFDEATSSLDSISERYVKKALDSLSKQGKTIIVIAHRLSTVKTADNIVVLDQGKVAESGNHQSLLSKMESTIDYGKNNLMKLICKNMNIQNEIYRRLKMHELLLHSNTGTPEELSQKLHVSKRQLYNLVDEFRAMGASIKYSRESKTYYYTNDFDLKSKILKL